MLHDGAELAPQLVDRPVHELVGEDDHLLAGGDVRLVVVGDVRDHRPVAGPGLQLRHRLRAWDQQEGHPRDGELARPELVDLYGRHGFDVLSVTDHVNRADDPWLPRDAPLRGVDALRIFSTTLVLTGAEGVPVLSTYAYMLWSDSQKPRVAMAASVILALMVTVLGLAGIALARRFKAAELAP